MNPPTRNLLWLCLLSIATAFGAPTSLAQSPAPQGEEVISVEQWGAKGFPADDTEAIQAALDFARETPCVLFFPAPRYLVHRTLTIENPSGTRSRWQS